MSLSSIMYPYGNNNHLGNRKRQYYYRSGTLLAVIRSKFACVQLFFKPKSNGLFVHRCSGASLKSMTGKPQLGSFISSSAVFQEVLVGYGLERYLALIGRRLDYRAEDYPLTFLLRIKERFTLGIGEELCMIEAVYGKALRYDGHTFEVELIEQCAIARGRKIALPPLPA